jgi:hypothetical protein
MSSEPRIGRVLVASLHQAITDVLPDRVEFYENWLNAPGLREGTIGLAPLSAVLSFLRLEGEAYNRVTALAGEYAADWTVSGMSALERRVIGLLPTMFRTRRALRAASALIRATYPASGASVRLRRGTASIDLRGSLFCEVREATTVPLCGFYASAIARVLHRFDLRADAQVHECRASSRGRTCRLNVEVHGARTREPAAAPDWVE